MMVVLMVVVIVVVVVVWGNPAPDDHLLSRYGT